MDFTAFASGTDPCVAVPSYIAALQGETDNNLKWIDDHKGDIYETDRAEDRLLLTYGFAARALSFCANPDLSLIVDSKRHQAVSTNVIDNLFNAYHNATNNGLENWLFMTMSDTLQAISRSSVNSDQTRALSDYYLRTFCLDGTFIKYDVTARNASAKSLFTNPLVCPKNLVDSASGWK
jgi:hypothetical protein